MSVVEPDESDHTAFEGFLNKRGNKGFQFFKRRYFVLREDDLYYCYDNSMASMLNPLGKIDVKKISQVQLMLDIASLFGPPQHHLYLHTPTRIYILSTDVKKDAIKWSNCLEEARLKFKKQIDENATLEKTDSGLLSPIRASQRGDLFEDDDNDDGIDTTDIDNKQDLDDDNELISASAGEIVTTSSIPNYNRLSADLPSTASNVDYLAVPLEIRKVFAFTEGFGFEEFKSTLEPTLKNSIEYGNKKDNREASSLFAASLLIRSLGADAIQYNDCIKRTCSLPEIILRQYASLHQLIVDRLELISSSLSSQTKQLDIWLVTYRQKQLFGRSCKLSLAMFDRMGILRWHILMLCEFAANYLEPLRSNQDEQASQLSLSSVLYAWDTLVDAIVGEIARLPSTTCGVFQWQLLLDSDSYRKDEKPVVKGELSENPLERQLSEARQKAGFAVAAALATRLPRLSASEKDIIRRLLHADLLLRQLLEELDTLGITDTHIRWVNAVQGAQTATNAALDDLQALKPYRTTVRSIRHSLMSEWRKSAQSSGAASLLLERTRATMTGSNDNDIVVRLCAICKRVASLIDATAYPSLRDAVLLAAVQLHEFLPKLDVSVESITLT